MNKKQIIYIKLDKILPDIDQPRRNFDAKKLAILANSIKANGVLDPLKVEKLDNEQYLLVDGERRYRACKISGEKEVPVIIMENLNMVERLVKQFHLQETHESWSTAERAKSLSFVAEQSGCGIEELGKMLGLPERTVEMYLAFGKVINKDKYIKSEISSDFIEPIGCLNAKIKKAYKKNHEGEEMPENSKQAFEEKIIDMIKNGSIKIKSDITKIGDACIHEPKLILQIEKGEHTHTSAESLFIQSKAQNQARARKIVSSARYLDQLICSYLKTPQNLFLEEDIHPLKRASLSLTKLLKQIDSSYHD